MKQNKSIDFSTILVNTLMYLFCQCMILVLSKIVFFFYPDMPIIFKFITTLGFVYLGILPFKYNFAWWENKSKDKQNRDTQRRIDKRNV